MRTILKRIALCVIMSAGTMLAGCESQGKDPWPHTSNQGELTAPADLAAGETTANGATLSWTGDATATGYEVRIGSVNAAVRTTATNTYTATDLTAYTSYLWAVRAIRGDEASEWVAGPQFTTRGEVPDPPTGLNIENLTPVGVGCVWAPYPEECTYTLRMQGEFTRSGSFDVSHLIDHETGDLVVSNPSRRGAGLDLTAGLLPETKYTWQLRVELKGEVSEWAEGPAFTTLKAFTVSDFTGNYTGMGEPKELDIPLAPPSHSTSPWQGSITSGSGHIPGTSPMDWFEVGNMFNSGLTSYLDYNPGTQWMFLNGYAPIGEPVEIDGEIYEAQLIGVVGYNDILAYWRMTQNNLQARVRWNIDTGTIAFPDNVEFYSFGWQNPAYGIGVVVDGSLKALLSDFYQNVVLTMDKASSRASFNGTRVDLKPFETGKGVVPIEEAMAEPVRPPYPGLFDF